MSTYKKFMRIERVEVFSYNNSAIFFKFLDANANGKETIGLTRTHRVFCNGEKVPRAKIKNAEKIAILLETAAKNLPTWAEIVPEKISDPSQTTHDGVKLINTYFAPTLWFSEDDKHPDPGTEVALRSFVDPSKPRDEIAISFYSTSGIVEKLQNTKTSEKSIQADSTHFNIEALVLSTDHFAKLEVRSAPDIAGKKILLIQNRLFINGVPVHSSKERAISANQFVVGQSVYCDLIPADKADGSRNTDCDFFATLAWIGTKPGVTLVNEYQKVYHEIQKGILVGLAYDSDGCVVGGALELVPWSKDTDRVRVWFDSETTFLHGVCLSKVKDLGELRLQKEKFYVHVGLQEPTEEDFIKINSMSVASEGLIWKKAHFVGIGVRVTAALFYEPPEKLFEVADSNQPLLEYLAKRNISVDKFRQLVQGNASQNKNKTELQGHEDTSVSSSTVDERLNRKPERCYGRVADLCKNPEAGGKRTVKGIMQLINGLFVDKKAPFQITNVYIFGYNMAKANLMDIILPDDTFNVELGSLLTKNIAIKSVWIGPYPSKPDSKLSANFETNPEFASWLEKHSLNEKKFFEAVEGMYLERPFFPIQYDGDAVKHIAKVVSLCRYDTKGQPSRGCEFGLLQITGPNDPLGNQLVVFENNDLYILFINICKGDLNYFLSLGQKVNCEVREMTGTEKSSWRKKLEFDAGGSNRLSVSPSYIANIVYIGGRPKPPMTFTPPPTEADVKNNSNMVSWLKKRVTPKYFCSILRGDARPKVIVEEQPDEATSVNPSDQDMGFGRPDAGFGRPDAGFGRPDAGFGRPDAEFGRPDLGFGRPDPGFGRPDPGFGKPDPGFSRPDSGYGRPDSGYARPDPGYGRPDHEFGRPALQESWAPAFPAQGLMNSSMNLRPQGAPEVMNPTASVVHETMRSAQTLLTRVMDCVSPDDPKVKDVIRNPADLQLALFISKTFASSILKYNSRDVPLTQRLHSFDDRPSISDTFNQSGWGGGYNDNGQVSSRGAFRGAGYGRGSGNGQMKRGPDNQDSPNLFKRRHND